KHGAGILSGCSSLDKRSRDAEDGFEPRTFRSVNPRSNHMSHLAPHVSNTNSAYPHLTEAEISEREVFCVSWNMRQSGAAHLVAWKHHKREIQLDSRRVSRKTKFICE
ncbi:hypothetical protein T265_12523, partial [Opisthorchis viverrini]